MSRPRGKSPGEITDPLRDFKRWEGEELGADQDQKPGFYGVIQTSARLIHVAAAHVTSTARRQYEAGKEPQLVPAAIIRLVAGVIGTGPRYHVLELVVDADIGAQLGAILQAAAQRSAEDLEADPTGAGLQTPPAVPDPTDPEVEAAARALAELAGRPGIDPVLIVTDHQLRRDTYAEAIRLGADTHRLAEIGRVLK